MALFKKFAASSPQTGTTPAEEVQDIVDNLNNILNIRQGYGSILPDLGIPDFSEYTSRDLIAKAIMEEVKRNIEQFEPRVEFVSITLMEESNPLRIAFRIDCKLRQTAQSLRMVFDSQSNEFLLDRL